MTSTNVCDTGHWYVCLLEVPVIRLSAHMSVQQMLARWGEEILPLPLTLKRDLESSPAITLSHQHLTCVTKIIFEEGENCAVYINLFFIS